MLGPVVRRCLCRASRLPVFAAPQTGLLFTYARQYSTPPAALDFKFLVVGGGTAGSAVAASLSRKHPSQVALLDSAQIHYNQPLWTLVGAGVKQAEESGRPMKDVVPNKASWFPEDAVELLPAANIVKTRHRVISYEYLVLACGLKIDFGKIEGLKEALKTPLVTSNYSPTLCSKTWDCIQNLKEGNAIFTYPAGPVKCGGAGQKIAYLAEDYWKTQGRRHSIKISYATALPRVFGVAHYADALEPLCHERNIHLELGVDLVKVDGSKRMAIFRHLLGPQKDQHYAIQYDLLHVVPKQVPHSLIQKSSLADNTGFVDVDASTLQHKHYHNVFAIGDCSNLPTSKTAAAVSSQLQVILANIDAVQKGYQPSASYKGYTSCPITTAYGKVMMCEFDYQGRPCESFPLLDQRRPSWAMWWIKTKALPILYWNFLLRGLAPWTRFLKTSSH